MTQFQTVAFAALLTFLIVAWSRTTIKTDPNKGTGFVVFGFLDFTFSNWPWQESYVHRQWRGYLKKNPALEGVLAEPPYKVGWKDSGCTFNRQLGIVLTYRDVRLDLWYGIVWISWAPFKVTPPK